MKEPKYFCSLCGTRCETELTPAENFQYMDFYPYSAYDRKTGKRQMVLRVRCPKETYFNKHDNYKIDKIINLQ